MPEWPHSPDLTASSGKTIPFAIARLGTSNTTERAS